MLECQPSRHPRSVGHRFLSTLRWCWEALISENCHPAVPRWPFHLRCCWWRAWNHSGLTSGRQCQLVILVHSCMPASISASWRAEHPSAFSDLQACSVLLESLWQWLLLPFWLFYNLRVFQFHDPMVFPKSFDTFCQSEIARKWALTKIKERN